MFKGLSLPPSAPGTEQGMNNLELFWKAALTHHINIFLLHLLAALSFMEALLGFLGRRKLLGGRSSHCGLSDLSHHRPSSGCDGCTLQPGPKGLSSLPAGRMDFGKLC